MRRAIMCYTIEQFEQIVNSNELRVVEFNVKPVEQSHMYQQGFAGVVVYDSENEFKPTT